MSRFLKKARVIVETGQVCTIELVGLQTIKYKTYCGEIRMYNTVLLDKYHFRKATELDCYLNAIDKNGRALVSAKR
jgi:hypothetical protein